MRKLFVAAVAAVIATTAFAAPSEAKTATKTVTAPAGVHKVVKVKTVRTHKVIKVAPRKTFAKALVCHRGFYRHYGQCVPMHRHHRHG